MAHLSPAIQHLLALPDAERRLGPFLLVEQLGRGGFAPVWLAREIYGATELRTAAVKLFAIGTRSDASASAAALRRQILEEARSLCQVEHPSVVRFYSLPIDETRGVMGLAMEYVAGSPLAQRIAAEGRLPVPEVIAIGIALASALAAVHRAGLVHRDVKPANVIEAAGVHKLIDFGIAATDERSAPRTRFESGPAELPSLPPETTRLRGSAEDITRPLELGDGAPLGALERYGTIGYIDPVVFATGAGATAASDLYALGATLFECLTGRLPARSPGGHGFSDAVLDGRHPAPPVGELAPEVPEPLARLVDTLLAPERAARPRSAEQTAIELLRIQAELAGPSRALPPEDIGPFRGLGRFGEKDRDVYFGRSSEIAATIESVRTRGLVALVGPSGSGKSSLARAGVLPRVAEGALGGWPRAWDTVITEPGHDPRAAIAAALSSFVPCAGALTPEALSRALVTRAREAERGIVLLVDQLDELVTLAGGPSRAWAIELLGQLAEPALPGVRVIVTLRRDLLDPLLALAGLGKALIRGSVLLEPMTESAWAAVIDQGLGAYGYALEDEALREEILADVRRMSSAMPLVQFALTELWDRRDREAMRITRVGVAAIGGIAGALERHAEATLADLGAEVRGAEAGARALLLALTTPRGTRENRSRPELEQAVGPGATEVIAAFEQARLVVASAEGLTLAHEALLAQWGRLRRWVEEARDDRLLAEELEQDATRWRETPALVPLWSRHRLAFAEDVVRREAARPSADARAFLAAARRAERRARLVITGAALAALVMSAGAGAAYVRAIRAKEAATELALSEQTRSRELAEQQTRDLRAAQDRIDKLMGELREAPSLAKLRELEQRMVEAKALGEPREKPIAAGRARPAASAETSFAAPASSAAPSAAPADTGAGEGLTVETEWGAGKSR
ncbi:protein kinase [Polyangium jinanense]|uniref:nSTAND1 domain-containing NTPase n=1 Tax=Polyangium jinanense TaxID=2829994 RepID=UPI0023407EEA|nr:protein kinase [Polyangium jinanense]MDC3957466.1 protein kinase [Polyangium jinanense]